MENSNEQIIELSAQEIDYPKVFEQIIDLFKDLKEEDADTLLTSFREKGIEVIPFSNKSDGEAYEPLAEISRSQIKVTRLSNSLSRLEFTALEVSLPGRVETRVTTRPGPLGVPIPVVQTRQRYRRLDVAIDVDRNVFASNISGFSSTQEILVAAVISFIICLFAAAVLIAALSSLLVVGPIVFSELMKVFLQFANLCASTVAAIATPAAVISSLKGKTNSVERWGDWG